MFCPFSGKRYQVLLKWRRPWLLSAPIWCFSHSVLYFRTFCQNKEYESGLVCVLQALEIYADEELQLTAINIRKKIARRQLKAQMETGPVWSRVCGHYHQCVLLLKSLLYVSFCRKQGVFMVFLTIQASKSTLFTWFLMTSKVFNNKLAVFPKPHMSVFHPKN